MLQKDRMEGDAFLNAPGVLNKFERFPGKLAAASCPLEVVDRLQFLLCFGHEFRIGAFEKFLEHDISGKLLRDCGSIIVLFFFCL